MDELKKLYYQYINGTEEYQKLGEMLEVGNTKKCLQQTLDNIKNGEVFNVFEFENCVCDYGCASEMQGWVYGFRYAVQLMATCGVIGGVPHE